MTDFLTHIRQKIVPRDYYARHREVLHRKKIVFTNGCFDILHTGHVTCLAKARQMGDLLVVGLNSDESVRRLKGAERPVNDEHSRALLLAALEAVDYVTIFEEDTPYNLICQVKPDILVKGGDLHYRSSKTRISHETNPSATFALLLVFNADGTVG